MAQETSYVIKISLDTVNFGNGSKTITSALIPIGFCKEEEAKKIFSEVLEEVD